MRLGAVRLFSLLLSLSLLLTSCGVWQGGEVIPEGEGVTDRFTGVEDKIADFSLGAPVGFWARNDRGNGSPFNCSFSSANAVIEDGLLTLTLTGSEGKYAGAEYRSHARLSYGYYSVYMRAARCDGVISSFFTYCGFPWDEIDIEFLGDDTTRVQFNYYTHGVGGHEYIYDLGFDAAEDLHEYGFDWQEGSITFYVDGRSVYRATENIPTSPGQIMMNLWCVDDSHAGWAGQFSGEGLPVSAQYGFIGYKAAE